MIRRFAPRFPIRAAGALVCLASAAATGCAAGSSRAVPDPGMGGEPALFAPDAPGDAAGEDTWWSAFGDPGLDEIVEAVIEANFSLAEATARVEQARTRARLANAAALPVAGARAGVEIYDLPVDAAIGAQLEELGLDFPLPERLGLTTATVGLEFGWEADFWGRSRAASRAAGRELLASESDVDAVRISIVAEAIAAYFDILHLQRQLEVAADQVALSREQERVAAARYHRGLAPAAELSERRRALEAAEAATPRLSARLAAARSALATLVGRPLTDIEPVGATDLPAGGAAPVPAAVPAERLLQRPDVRAAGHRLEAAGHLVEARRAALMPRLSLAGSIGLQSTELDGVFDARQWFANLASNLFRPVFDGGRLRSDVELAEARFDELAAGYGHSVLRAVNDVEAALAAFEEGRHLLDSARAQHELADGFLDLRSGRYAAGIGRYEEVLAARLALLQAKSELVESERALALARLAIHRALGGGWEETASATSRDEAPG